MPDILPPCKLRGGVTVSCGAIRPWRSAASLLVLMLLMAIFAPLLGTIDPTALAPVKRPREPSASSGSAPTCSAATSTAASLYGARVSLLVGFAVAILASLVGLAIGLVTGFVRWLDGVVMRVMDGLMSIPPILLAIALMALTRASMQNVIIAITVAEVPRVCAWCAASC